MEEGVLETQPTKYLDCMKNIVFTVLVLFSFGLSAQKLSNKEIVTEINHELGEELWRIQGDNLIVDYGSYSAGRGLWGLSRVEYELKYEYWSIQGEGQNMYVLHVKCKGGDDCIEDPTMPELPAIISHRFVLSGDEARAKRVYNLLLTLH